jgi:hypothetical protein
MNKITKTLRRPLNFIVGFAIAITLVSAWTLQQVAAATGSIYLTPGSKSVQINTNVTFSLRVDPGTSIQGVEAKVNFDTTKLEYVSYSSAGSAFALQMQRNVAGGTITLAYGASLGQVVTADSLIENITFKAKVSSGSSSITLTDANAVNNGAYTDPASSGATVNFTAAPAPACPSGQIGTYPNCKTPTPTPTPTPKPTTPSTGTAPKPTNTTNTTSPTVTPATPSTNPSGSKPEITGVTPSIQFTVGALQVDTSVPTTAYIKYGFTDSLNINSTVSPLGTSHVLALDPSMLVAGQTYYYAVVVTDQGGNQTQTETETFKTKGIPVKITVLDKNKKPLKNKTVVLHSDPITVKTDSNGVATISDAAPGVHQLRYTSGGKVYAQSITIENNVKTEGDVQSASVQTFSVAYDDLVQPNSPWLAYVGGLLLLTLLAAAGYFIIGKRNKLAPSSSFSGASVVTDDHIRSTTSLHGDITPDSEELKQKQLSKVQYPKVPSPGNVVQPNASDNEKESK